MSRSGQRVLGAGARVVGAATVTGTLPDGVRIRPLTIHRDDRGSLMEAFRQSWKGDRAPLQWNVVTSEAGVMRGVHVHLGYEEAYVLLRGRLVVGYRDARAGSPTEGEVSLVDVRGERPALVLVPGGIAHGLAFLEPSTLLIGVTAYWSLEHELGCHWRDPALGIPWPTTDLRTSERDAALPPLREILDRIPPWQPEP